MFLHLHRSRLCQVLDLYKDVEPLSQVLREDVSVKCLLYKHENMDSLHPEEKQCYKKSRGRSHSNKKRLQTGKALSKAAHIGKTSSRPVLHSPQAPAFQEFWWKGRGCPQEQPPQGSISSSLTHTALPGDGK
ncbi:uncharacterized protein LOC143441377 [Arvicanthis niloticus]|uniref:uncharacterized protein LOC143441377 n=1 Tax=Arvicanthis niloticus TaxID=61156 RepID=UPI00402B1A37